MGKSRGKKKKGTGSSVVNPIPNANGGAELDSSIFLKRAHELKEEGNKKFQAEDYVGALEQYAEALSHTPKTHPDRAIFHSNRAACLMQMKPIDYETAIAECSMALQVQPQFVRALLRRARAFEAVGEYAMAMQDIQVVLAADPIQRDALEIERRLRTALGPRQEAQQDLQSLPSPAALGASPVREDPELKEIEMDDWLFEFVQLFCTHVGIDLDGHIDLCELGKDLCSEAVEETVTSEEAQSLFDKAASKFQEVAALAFFNWGNVHMCAARKRIPLDESAGNEVMANQLQTAYDWVKEKYSLAREMYEESLSIKPDFYEGLLKLGHLQFEMAKLHWSFALDKKLDLSSWDSTETLKLFDSAEEKMKAATEMWEKLEEQRAKELKDPSSSKREELLKRKKKQGSAAEGETSGVGAQGELSADEAAEQVGFQIQFFWGNILFERSQVEYKLGFNGWKKNLDAAVERFKLAGASETDISTSLKNHFSNVDLVEGNKKKVENLTNIDTEADTKDDDDKVVKKVDELKK